MMVECPKQSARYSIIRGSAPLSAILASFMLVGPSTMTTFIATVALGIGALVVVVPKRFSWSAACPACGSKSLNFQHEDGGDYLHCKACGYLET